MKRKSSAYIISIICFILLAAICIAGANFILTPKWSIEFRSGTNIRGFYEMPDNSVDVLLLGSSHIVSGMNPNLMYEQYGISAYCCGTEAQPMLGSYVWLLEALKTQDIKAVVLDIQELFLDGNEINYRKAFDHMKLSQTKIQALKAYRAINPDMDFISYLLPLMQYHGRYTELTEEDFTGDRSDAYRGFLISTQQRGMDFEGIAPTGDETPTEIRIENSTYFRAICELCEKRNIALVLLITPDLAFTAEMHAAAQKLADEYGLPFFDFNIVSQWTDFDYATGMADFRHVNSLGAAYITPIVTDKLLSMCELPDRSGDSYMDELDAIYVDAMAAAESAEPEISVN